MCKFCEEANEISLELFGLAIERDGAVVMDEMWFAREYVIEATEWALDVAHSEGFWAYTRGEACSEWAEMDVPHI